MPAMVTIFSTHNSDGELCQTNFMSLLKPRNKIEEINKFQHFSSVEIPKIEVKKPVQI